MSENVMGPETTVGPVVVGVDGSVVSERALLWAAEQARRTGVALRVVLVRPHPIPVTAMATDPVWPWPVIHARNEQDVAAAKELLTTTVESTIPNETEIDIEVDVVDGPTGSSLIDVAVEVNASMIVVGRRGIGGFKRLLLGSVSEEVSTYAMCPVVVTAADAEPSDSPVVVVGVDGSERADIALRWAGEQARVTRARLHVVHTWERLYIAPDSIAGTLRSIGPDADEVEALERQVLLDVVDRARADLEGIEVTTELRDGHPSEQLVEAASDAGAQLLVVGTRGLGGFTSMLLGSVAQQSLRHATCPVAVIRPQNA